MTVYNFTSDAEQDTKTFFAIMDRETNRLLERALTEIGAILRPNTPLGPEYWVWTAYGPALCSPRGNCVFFQFQEPKLANKSGLPFLNQYTGKWNMHWNEKLPPQSRVEMFLRHMELCGAKK